MTEKQKQLAVNLLCLVGFFGIFSTTISKNPVLPLFVQSLGAGTTLLGFLAALSPLAGILFSFPVGFLADRWGKKKLLVISATIFVTAPLMYLLVTSAWCLVPIRFFHGMATAILGPVASAMICEVYEQKKAESLGVYSSATMVGRMLAPLLGGFIIGQLAGAGGLINYQMVYLAAFLLAIPVLILILLIKETDEKKAGVKTNADIKGLLLALRDFERNQMVFLTSLIEMATYFIFGVFETYLPIYLSTKNIPATKIGLIFSLQVLSIALTKPFFGKLADSIDKRIQIIAGILILSAAMAGITNFSNYSILIGCSLVFGLGMSLSTVATGAYVADLAKEEELGSFMGALSSMMDIGQTSGPFLIGFVITAFSIQAGFGLSAILAVVVTGVFIAALVQNRLKPAA
jgi:MFS family permease